MKQTKRTPPRPPPPPPNRSVREDQPPQQVWTGKRHLTMLCFLLAGWLLLFALVLLEHARSWARLLPVLFVVLVVYGAMITRKIIKETKHSRE
jgi:hypothetical protein